MVDIWLKPGIVCLTAFLILLAPDRADSQRNPALPIRVGVDDENESQEEFNPVFLPAPRELTRLATRAKRAIDERRFADAVEMLGQLLQDDQAEDYFVGSPTAEGTRASLKAEALRLLGSMPAAGRQSYELQFGDQAQRLLDHALETGSESELSRVSRKFFHTRAGYEATMLLGRLHLTQGRPLTSAAILQRLAEAPAAKKAYEPDLSLLIATCWQLAGVEDSAIERLRLLYDQRPDAKFTVGATEYSLRDLPGTDNDPRILDEQLRKLLDRMLPDQLLTPVAVASQWLMFRGNPSRNADSQGGWPLSTYRWRVMTTQGITNPLADDMIRDLRKQYSNEGRPSLPAAHPLAVGDYILMRTPDRLFGVNLRTGKSVWEYPAFGSTLLTGSDPGAAQENPTGADNMNQTRAILQHRLWEDSRVGQISSDGQRVFLIDQSQDFNRQPFRTSVNNQLRGQVIVLNMRGGKRQKNHLVALDVQRQGAIAWSSRDDPHLEDAFFLGAPLPLADQLFATVEVFGEIRLVVLKAETGEILWSQQLAHIEPNQSMLPGGANASPAFHDGVLVCPTGARALVGVDLATRSLLWGYQYGPNLPRQRQPNIIISGRFGTSSADHWADSGPTLADGSVIFAPPEGGQLLCMELLTGKVKWKIKKRSEMLYVAGVREGVVVVVGRKTVTGYQLSDGEIAWSGPIQLPTPAALPSGRGFFLGNDYYLPTSAPELLKIDCVAGNVIKQTALKHELGNLICYRNQIISLGYDQLVAFHQEDYLHTEIQQRLRDNPEDAWALEHYGAWLVDNGRRSEAMVALRRALNLYSDDEPRRVGAQSLLVQTLLDALRDNFAENRQLAREVDGLIQQPREREQYLRLMADGLNHQQQWPAAFGAYLELADFLTQQTTLPTGSTTAPQVVQLSRHHKVRYGQWIGQRLDEIFRQTDSTERNALTEEIDQRLQQALNSNVAKKLQYFVQLFPDQPQSDVARLALARRLADDDRMASGQMVLSHLEYHAQHEQTAARATWELAQSLASSGRVAAAARQYQTLARRWPAQAVVDGKSGSELVAELSHDSPVGRRLHLVDDWPVGQVTLDTTSIEARADNAVIHVPIIEAEGPRDPGMQIYTNRTGTEFVILDAEGRETARTSIQKPANIFYFPVQYFAAAKTAGPVVLVSLGFDIVALDTSSVKKDGQVDVLWREDLRSDLPATDDIRSRFSVTTVNTPFGVTLRKPQLHNRPVGQLGPVRSNGVCFQRQRELTCVDLTTGTLKWSRSDVPAGSELLGTDQYVMAIAPGTHEGRAFSMADGDELFSCEVPRNRWKTFGGHIVYWTQRPFGGKKPITLGLFDTLTQKDVWQYDFQRRSQIELINDDELAVIQRDGQLAILSLRDGQRRIERKLASSNGPHSLNILRTSESYLIGVVAVNRGVPADSNSPPHNAEEEEDPSEPEEVDPFGVVEEFKNLEGDTDRGNRNTPASRERIEGQVYALSRATGNLLWERPVKMGQFIIPPHQPLECPLLFVVRPVPNEPGQAADRRRRSSKKQDLICLDRRTGQSVAQLESQAFISRPHVIRADADKRQVTADVSSRQRVTMTFSDQPVDDTER